MNGYEVCRRVRQEPWGRAMLLVALTGWGQEEDREQSRDAGFDAHMVKPVDHEALLDLIARSMNRVVS
jgi:CheY-like chemotaxis protein